ncbi:unnamed protein product [Closterium sp. NIES-64]|nr:unnamed protein product [Closterium sp. NIES-64]
MDDRCPSNRSVVRSLGRVSELPPPVSVLATIEIATAPLAMPTGFTGAPEAVGEVWKADWYIPHCYKIPALAQLNHLLAQIPRAPTRSDVWHAGAGPADLRRFHNDLGEVVSEAELAQKQLGIFLQAVQTTAAGLQKEIGKRLSAENPSVFRKWIQKLPGFDDPLLAGGVGGGVGHDGSHSRSNSNSSGGAGSGGNGNAACGKLTDGSNASSPANKVSSDSPRDDSAPTLQPSKVALANRMRSKSMNVVSSGSLFRSPDDSSVAKPLGPEVSPIFASTGLTTPGSNGSGAGSGAGGSATRKMFTRAFSVRERPSAVSGGDGGGNSVGSGGGGGGGFLDACGFSPVLLRARNAGRVGPVGEHEGEGAGDTPAMGLGGGNGGNGGNGGVNGGGNGGNGGRDGGNGGGKVGGVAAWATPSGIGNENAAFPVITEAQQQQVPQGPLAASSPLHPPRQPASERHSGPLLHGTGQIPDSHADAARKGPAEKQPSAKPSGSSSKVGISGLLFRSRSSKSGSHRWTQSQQQQLQQRVAEEEEEGGEQEEQERGRLSPSSGHRIEGGASGKGTAASRRVGGPRLTKSRSEKAPSSAMGGARGGARGGKSGHERLQEILSSVGSGWGGLPLTSSLSGGSVSSSGSGLRGGSLVSRSATVSGAGPALGGMMGPAGRASVIGSAGGSMSGSMSVSVIGSAGVSPRGPANESFAFSHLPQAHRLSLASQSQDSSSSDYAMSPYGGSDRGGVQAERGREQEGGSGVLQGSRVLLSPAKAAQEEKLLEMLRSTPPVRWDKPVKAFPKDDPTKAPHLTAFLGYKAGMTHIVREVEKPGSRLHKKEAAEAVTIVETPPMIVCGLVAYVKTAHGPRTLTHVYAGHLSDNVRRRWYKNWHKSKKKAFTKYAKKFSTDEGKKEIEEELERMKKHASIIRVMAHTEVHKLKGIKQKKSHLMEIQINGGTIEEKVDWGYKLFEKAVPIDAVFRKDEMIDVIAITKGHGNEGVVHRWGVTRLPRKTHRGLRKVACIGAWHPARVPYTVARAGQNGYHHRTELNKKIYKIGKKGDESHKASTEYDRTDKEITPMGGFAQYGVVGEDYIMIKGCCPGVRKRVLTLRRSLLKQTSRNALEEVKLKFIDTRKAALAGMGLVWRAAKMLDASWHELAFIHASSSTVGYRPHVRSTTLAHLIATNCGPFMLPILPIRDRIRDKVEEAFGMQLGLLVEFTGIISWLPGATIGWHADDNRPYLKQRAFAVKHSPFARRNHPSRPVAYRGPEAGKKAEVEAVSEDRGVRQVVCGANQQHLASDGLGQTGLGELNGGASEGNEKEGSGGDGVMEREAGNEAVLVPIPLVASNSLYLVQKEGQGKLGEGEDGEVEGGEKQGGSEGGREGQGEGEVDIRIQELASMGWKAVPFLQSNCNATMQSPPGSDGAGLVKTESEWVALVPSPSPRRDETSPCLQCPVSELGKDGKKAGEVEKDVAGGKERQGHEAGTRQECIGGDYREGCDSRGGGGRGDSVGEKARVLASPVVFYNILHALQVCCS